jgi:hypothetical protein
MPDALSAAKFRSLEGSVPNYEAICSGSDARGRPETDGKP